MRHQVRTMLELQDAMNRRVNQDWRERQHEWYRAIWVECAELLDHYGWKWWKKQDPDHDQVVLELVDIWHFGLSIVLTQHDDIDSGADVIIDHLACVPQVGDFREDVERFAQQTLASREFDLNGYLRLLAGVGLSFEELFKRYVGKNVLNFFRQDHGYQEGKYQKIWQGREDNEHLVDILGQLDHQNPEIRDRIYSALKERYPVAKS